MAEIHLWPEEAYEQDDQLVVGARIEGIPDETKHLWYRLPVAYKSALTESCDPFVVAYLLDAMHCAADFIVHGEVSPSLLQNLEEFQDAWAIWKPRRYTKVDILADYEREQIPPDTTATVMTFSGGVDACFTAYRHRTGKCGRWQRNLRAGLMIHGFDMTLRKANDYQRALKKSGILLQSLGMELIPVATNLRKVLFDPVDAQGNFLASCLTLLKGEYISGLIAGSFYFPALIFPWGTNPITDPLLSSDSFRIIHDGTGYSRFEKVRQIAEWSETLTNLRVCIVGENKDRNCCRCEKCIRTILSYRAWGLGLPTCFKHDVSKAQILKVRMHSDYETYELIVETNRGEKRTETWIQAVRLSILLNRMRERLWKYPLIRRLKRLIIR